MTTKRIIKNYTLKSDPKSVENKAGFTHFPKVIINPDVTPKERVITNRPPEDQKQKEPRIELQKDSHGVITAIHVECTCGEKFSIQMEYE